MSSYSLTSWLKAHLSTLYESPPNAGEQDFQESLDLALAPDVQIVLNHKAITRNAFKEDTINRNAAATSVSIEWKDIAELEDSQKEGGIVAGFFVITRSLRFRIRAAPAQTNTFVTFSAEMEPQSQDQDSNKDPRRIVSLFLTYVDKAAPINLEPQSSSSS